MSYSLQPHGLQPTRLLCLYNSPGKNVGVGCHSLLQRIFPTQGSNTGLLHCSKFFYCLTHQAIFFFPKYDIKWLSYNISQDKHQSTIQESWICGVVGNNSSSSLCTFPGYWKFTQTKPMQVSFVKQKFTRKQRIFPRTTGTLTTEMLVSKKLGVKISCLYITR